MKTKLIILTLAFFISMPTLAEVTLISTRGPYKESYRKVVSHGAEFNCLVVEKTDPDWDIKEKEKNDGVVLLRVLNRDMKAFIDNNKKSNPDYCKKFQVMKDSRMAEERVELRQLAGNLVIRLVDASKGSNLEEMARSSKPNLAICVQDLVNVAQLTQIEKACLEN